jgi:flagellar biosynthesis protein FlhF
MRLKSYFSGTVEGAMALARKEMGDEAMLVNARPAMPEMRYLGAYEVVFGLDDQPAPPPSAARPEAPKAVAKAPARSSEASTDATPSDWLTRQVESLREDMLRMSASIREPAPLEPEPLDTGFSVEPTVGRHGVKRALAALVGPAGGGKTTTLAKLAARCGLAARKPTHLLSADTFRIGAADQLRTIASLMGVGFDLAQSVTELDRLAALHRDKDLVLIDTPGLSGSEMDDARDLIDWVAHHPELDTHLVLPASLHPDDMERIADHYQCFAPRKILFTHLDETLDCRRLLRLSARTGLPISFLTQGQRIPEDIELSSHDRLVELASRNSLRKGAAA